MHFIDSDAFLEIERKYSVKEDYWNGFVSLCKALKPHEEKIVYGPDTYYECKDKALRWRFGSDLSQITVKQRYSDKSSFVRAELEVDLKNRNPKAVIRFIKGLGYSKLFRIYKYCHIFSFKTELGGASVVIYRVDLKNSRCQYFVEIEADKGQPVEVSKKIVRYWENKLEIPKRWRVNKTLLEIYSDKRTEPVRDDVKLEYKKQARSKYTRRWELANPDKKREIRIRRIESGKALPVVAQIQVDRKRQI